MPRPFSRLNLLQNSRYLSPFKKGLSQLLQLDYSVLKIQVPYYDYLRGQVFIDDIKSVYEDCPETFDLGALFSLLHDDFLYHTMKGKRTHQQTAQYLLYGKAQYLTVGSTATEEHEHGLPEPKNQKKDQRKLKQVSTYTFVFEDEDEDELVKKEEKKSKKSKDLAEITLRLKESKIQRTEILLYDVSAYMNDIVITVEELLTIVYLDFIQSIKQEGNNDKVMRSILKGLDFYS